MITISFRRRVSVLLPCS